MKKNKLQTILTFALILFTLNFSNLYSTTKVITVGNFQFTPPSISASVGDTIIWIYLNGVHTTTCNGSQFTSLPSGAAPWSIQLDPSNPQFLYVLTVAGTYNYKCQYHAPGMVGVLNVTTPPVMLNLTSIIEGFWNGTFMPADTVKVYLRSAVSPFSKVDSAKIKLNILGNGVLTFTHAAGGSYYIVVTHRNSIETWSRFPQAFTNGGTLNYDFTTAANKAFGDNLILKLGKFTLYSGDVNQDGSVDLTDISLIDNASFSFVTGYVPTDLNDDGMVDISDASIADNNSFNFVSKITPLTFNSLD